jgi:hypothetical protein
MKEVVSVGPLRANAFSQTGAGLPDATTFIPAPPSPGASSRQKAPERR